ncbi:hypothetical protein ACJX0J_007507 [Zea mays]
MYNLHHVFSIICRERDFILYFKLQVAYAFLLLKNLKDSGSLGAKRHKRQVPLDMLDLEIYFFTKYSILDLIRRFHFEAFWPKLEGFHDIDEIKDFRKNFIATLAAALNSAYITLIPKKEGLNIGLNSFANILEFHSPFIS